MHTTAYGEQQTSTVPRNKQEPLKPKVTFAAPQSMLTQPASEPTTRAIDIEWMRDDEEAYNEEMESQRKKVNKRLVVFSVVSVCVIGGGIAWGVTQWLHRDVKDKVSVESLIKEKDATEAVDDDIIRMQERPDTNAIAEQDVSEQTDESVVSADNDTRNDEKSPSDITVQVLNAGAATGLAGKVTKDFSEKGYKVQAAKNAQNSYEDVTIYYNAQMQDHVDAISAMIDEKYGTQKREASDSVTEKYHADIVIVLGT